MDMIFCPLYSGSSGNSLFVRYGQTSLLVDAGLSGRITLEALKKIEVDPASLNGLLVTHDHSDHIKGVGVLSRKLKLPVYATEGTWRVIDKKCGDIAPECRRVIRAGEDFYVDQIGVEAFATPHDAEEPVGFRMWGGALSVSVATDLGWMPQRVEDALAGSSLILLESNHDPDMLLRNPNYSSTLKQRILSRHGHLSNETASEKLVALAERGTHNFILGHLSGENNTPELALQTSENRAELEGLRLGEDILIDLAWRDRVGSVYTLHDTL